MTDLDRVYRDAERYMRAMKLRVPAEIEVETGVSLGWRKMTPRGWSLVYIERREASIRVVPIAEAPELFRLKAADCFGALLDAVQSAPLPVVDDPAMRSIAASLGEGDDER